MLELPKFPTINSFFPSPSKSAPVFPCGFEVPVPVAKSTLVANDVLLICAIAKLTDKMVVSDSIIYHNLYLNHTKVNF